MKKLRTLYAVIIIVIIVTVACKSQVKQPPFEKIINQTFLAIVDTLAYANHDFFLVPGYPDEYAYRKNWGYNICYNENIESSKVFTDSLPQELINLKKEEYLYLFIKDSIEQPIQTLKAASFINTGKYKMIANTFCDKLDTTYVGTIKFYQPLIGKSHAIFFIFKSSSRRGGRTSAYLLKLVGNKWQKDGEIGLVYY